MKLISTIAAALAMGITGMATAGPSIDRVPVDLQLVGDDGLSQNLHFQLEAGLQKDDRLRPATASDVRAIVIKSDSNVHWDKLNGREVAIVIVYVYRRNEERGYPIVRACWANDVKSCAREIIRVTRIQAQSRF